MPSVQKQRSLLIESLSKTELFYNLLVLQPATQANSAWPSICG